MDLINPDFDIDQINETLINPSHPYLIGGGSSLMVDYTLDGYRVEIDSAIMPQVSVQQWGGMFGAKSSILFTVMQKKASTAATDNDNMEVWLDPDQISKYMWGTPYAIPMTFSFDANTANPGTYSVSMINGLDTVFCIGTYTTVTGSTPVQRCSVTFPAITTGDFSLGAKLLFDLGSGPNFTATGNLTWGSGAGWKASGSMSLTEQPVGSFLQLGRFQIDAGTVAQPYRTIPMEQKLRNAQRYLNKTMPQGVAVNNAVRGGAGAGLEGALKILPTPYSPQNGGFIEYRFPVEMTAFFSPIVPNCYGFSPTVPNSANFADASGGDSGPIGFWNPALNSVGVENVIVNPPTGHLFAAHVVVSTQQGGNGFLGTFAP